MAATLAATIKLPQAGGRLEDYALHCLEPLPSPASRFQSRIAFAAAHVIADPLRTTDPLQSAAIDMEATLAFRRHLWSLGFGVAEAMDTAQRGMGLDWPAARELIRHSCAEAAAQGLTIACGVNTDQVSLERLTSLDQVAAAYQEQCASVESCGGQPIIMASRALARLARSPEDYLRVYRRLLHEVSRPAILHWLGEAFDPSLHGYWGGSDLAHSMEICLALIHEERAKIDGVKISLLDARREIEMRRRLPAGVRMYTGDDFHYPDLIQGDELGYSDALLGIFDCIAPAAALAFEALDRGNVAAYRTALEPTLALSRQIFATPTYYYKTGLVFLSYLNGFQNHFRMLGGQESARSLVQLSQVFQLADQANLLSDPERAISRMKLFLALSGVC